ncbi:MAG: hypothetical protein R6V19_04035 [Armatimonadota bacterium]
MRTVRYIAAIAVFVFMVAACHAQDAPADTDETEPGPLKVGISSVDITPEGPVWMAGFAARDKVSEGVYRPIIAQCLVFDNGQTRLAFITMDLCKIYERELHAFQEAAADVGIPPQHVMVNWSHTHCGPHLSRPESAEYREVFAEKTLPLLQQAVDDLQPAVLDYTVGSCTMAVNRRQLDENHKSVGMRPEPRKEIDPDVPVLRVLSPDGTVRVVIFGYACHPTTMGGYEIGTDYPGFARDWVKAAYPDAEPVFMQGCAGDIKPRYVKPNGRFGYVLLSEKETVAEMGHELGRAVCTATCVPLSPVPADRPEDLEEAAEHPVPLGGIAERVHIPDLDTEGKYHTIYNGAWRVGDVYIFGSQCEIGSQIGLRIKRALADMRVWTNGYTFWGGGYITDAEQYPEGGYEVDRASTVAPGTDSILVKNAIRYIRELEDTPLHEGPIVDPDAKPDDEESEEQG